MGILRSLGALARGLGPVVCSSGRSYSVMSSVFRALNSAVGAWFDLNLPFFAVYWIAGAQTCFLLTSATFIVPLVLLRRAGRLKEE